MQILYYKDPAGNFGDDLNAVLWDGLLAPSARASDKFRLLGVGSILNAKTLAKAGPGAPIVVMGSGTSYGHPPPDPDALIIKAVRGELTARVIGRPEAAVTDGAILMAAVPGFLPAERTASTTVFIPHHLSMKLGHWRRAAEAAGMVFVDPRRPVGEVLRVIAGARRVVTEAMHGAVFADTLRIPWTPVVSSARIDAFKWLDWTLSMELPYQPHYLRPSTWMESREVKKLQALFDIRTAHAPALTVHSSRMDLAAYLIARNPPSSGRTAKRPAFDAVKRATVSSTRPLANLTHIPSVADDLRRAASGPGFISTDRVFQARLGRMQVCVESLQELI